MPDTDTFEPDAPEQPPIPWGGPEWDAAEPPF